MAQHGTCAVLCLCACVYVAKAKVMLKFACSRCDCSVKGRLLIQRWHLFAQAFLMFGVALQLFSELTAKEATRAGSYDFYGLGKDNQGRRL